MFYDKKFRATGNRKREKGIGRPREGERERGRGGKLKMN